MLSLKRYAKAPTFPEFVDFLLNTEVCNCTAINIKKKHIIVGPIILNNGKKEN